MKEIDLTQLAADPLSKARTEAGAETSVVSGFVRDVSRQTISIAETRTSSSFTELERSSIVAAFEDDQAKDKITLVVLSDAVVKIVTTRRLKAFRTTGNSGCSDIGVAEARPLDSIHPALAELAREMARIKADAAKGSNELTCAEKRADCYRDPEKTKETCNIDFMMCRLDGFFNA